MTVVPLVSVDRLETELYLALHAEEVHEARCDAPVPELCDDCAEHALAVERCERRLEAARSQQPDRHIDPSATERRRLERMAGEAA